MSDWDVLDKATSVVGIVLVSATFCYLLLHLIWYLER